MNRHWLIIYDIRDEGRLRRIAKIMEGYGIRVQKSVFEAEAPRRVIDRLRAETSAVMAEEDFVVYFDVCEPDWQRRRKYGVGARLARDDRPFAIL